MLWHFPAGSGIGSTSTLSAAGDTLYFGTFDRSLYAVSAVAGTRVALGEGRPPLLRGVPSPHRTLLREHICFTLNADFSFAVDYVEGQQGSGSDSARDGDLPSSTLLGAPP